MKILKDRSTKRVIILNIAIIILFMVVFSIITKSQYKTYKNILNSKIENIVNSVKKEYPDIKEEQIVQSLKDENKSGDFLKKYGYTEESIYIREIENSIKKNNVVNVTVLLILGISDLIIYIIYIIRQNRKIQEINKYLKEINNKNYRLKIEENGEEELSKLRNELYKTTVLLKETAENSEREKEQLSNSLADISHQLKTPLTSIMILLDNINENPNMDEKTKMEFIREISKQIEWINSLVITLLKLAKFDAGVIEMNNVEINVSELISRVLSNLSILMELKNIEVITKIDKRIVFIGDYKWQLEALTNIIKNAAEHSKENAKIYIEAEDSTVFLKIKITDQGNGMEKEDVKHIFERFYRAKNSSNNGIGIGLSLSKMIIEKNNGYIKVDSKINEGTTFEVKYIK